MTIVGGKYQMRLTWIRVSQILCPRCIAALHFGQKEKRETVLDMQLQKILALSQGCCLHL